MDRTAGNDAARSVLPGGGGSPAGDGHARRPHTAAFVGSDAELLAAAVPFVEEGLRRGDLTLFSCQIETAEVVRAALGERAAAVECDQRISMVDTRAPDAVVATREWVERAAATGSGWVRVLGELPHFTEGSTCREYTRYESAVNRLLAEQPVAAMCVYDTRFLSEEAIAVGRETHPDLVVDGRRRPSPDFCEPEEYLGRLPVPREPVEESAPVYAVDDAPTLAGLRHALDAVLRSAVPDQEQREDLHLALSEVAANAFRHGVRPVSARLWAGSGRVVCTITDRGRSFADPLAGFQPAHGEDLSRGGMGLWLARKLWDSVDLLPGPAGLTVRLSTGLR